MKGLLLVVPLHDQEIAGAEQCLIGL